MSLPILFGRRAKNLLRWSEDFSQGTWGKNAGATVTGTSVLNASAGYLQCGVAMGPPGPYTFAVLVSVPSAITLRLELTDGSDGVPAFDVFVPIGPGVSRIKTTGFMPAGTGLLAGLIFANASVAVTIYRATLTAGSSFPKYQKTS